ncbi:WcaI family glycosyltransferase [Pedobacter sp. JY14-1]|uniref:WcaI family glycosyltransferase n=1 Tax=Pedobacter sp. JY14-1 TaxID=3034151 RepID=UPI0023E2EFA2|nr:WcaI family glycosyltransferase [Pedobacter sp. JY14-1]
MKRKRILVIGINSVPELTGIGKYTGDMLYWLVDQGHDVTMVTAPPYYPQWKVAEEYSTLKFKKERIMPGLTIYRCPLYVPARPNGKKRILHEASFFITAFLVVARLLFKKRYDNVIVAAPPFHLGLLGLFYRFFRKTRLHYHLQDLQVDAARELGMLKSGWLLTAVSGLEKYILRNADIVSTISAGMKRKVKAKVARHVALFPNWVDTKVYFPVSGGSALKREFGFLPEDKIVLYSGSIGEKQGLEMILDVALMLKEQSALKLVICAEGPFKEDLKRRAAERNAGNIFFIPLQPKDNFNKFLNMADVHLVIQKSGAGDLVMPSKLASIFAVGGLVIVTAATGTSLFEQLNRYDIGLVIPPDDPEGLARAIVNSLDTCHCQQRVNARVYAEQYLCKSVILGELPSLLDGV